MCECYQIGGRFIAEDPDCPVHGRDNLPSQIERLESQCADLLEALQVLAGIPVESFGKENKPDYALIGWNDHKIKVADVLKARAVIKKATE